MLSESRLTPHESSNTDIILCGHSLGGILAAEVALMKSSGSISLKHNILGTINFDTPFLGMHPGIIAAGISSIFSTNHSPAKSPQVGETPPLPFVAPGTEAYFNTRFANDVSLPTHSGWANALNFVKGNTQNLRSATTQLISSYVKFGACLADYDGLKDRYRKVRMLEEEEEEVRRQVLRTRHVARVRFVNYYTVSTGKLKRPAQKSSSQDHVEVQSPHGTAVSNSESQDGTTTPTASGATTEKHERRGSISSLSSLSSQSSQSSYFSIASEAREDDIPGVSSLSLGSSSISPPTDPPPQPHHTFTMPPLPSLPPMPALPDMPRPWPLGQPPMPPIAPPLQNPSAIQSYEVALEAYEQQIQAYRAQVKSLANKENPQTHPLNPKEQQKLDKATRATAHANEKAHRAAEKAQQKSFRAQEKAQQAAARAAEKAARAAAKHAEKQEQQQQQQRDATTRSSSDPKPTKPKRDRTFCVLPPVDAFGMQDPCWIKVFMAGVDEVGAHCGLFFAADADAHAAAAATAAGNGGLPTSVSSAGSVGGSSGGDGGNALTTVPSGTSVVEYLGNSEGPSGPLSSAASASAPVSGTADEATEADDPPEQYPGAEHKEGGGEDEEESQHWGERYANLVQDVAGRLEMWVLLAASERVAAEEAGMERWN